MAEDDDKPPRLKVVSDNPTARADRQTDWAKQQAQNALSHLAAALLRTMAGNVTEATYLMHRLSEFIDALNQFHKSAGRGMTVEELREGLRLPEVEMDYSSDDEWRHRHWLREHGMDVIVKGALRLAAHKVLGEEPAFGGMHSERVIEQGIKTLEELKRPPPPPGRKGKNLAHSWDDYGWGPSGETPLPRSGDPSAKPARARPSRNEERFSEGDLKELRKAIKANDKKRIAELTAKIGKPTFEK